MPGYPLAANAVRRPAGGHVPESQRDWRRFAVPGVVSAAAPFASFFEAQRKRLHSGRFPCSGRVLHGGRLVNVSQSRTYDTDSQAMVIAVTLDPAPGGAAATPTAPPVLHFMHTSQPAVRNVTVSAAGMPPVGLEDGCWWLARQGPWWVVAVNSSVAAGGGVTVSVYMW